MRLIGSGGVRTISPKKHELWQFVEVDGKRKQKTRTVTGGKKDAYKALRDFQNELADQVPTSDTFSAYAASWLAWRVSCGRYATSTIKNCASVVRMFEPYFGVMSDVTPATCRAAFMDVQKKRNLTGTTMRTKYAILHALFAQAVKDGVISTNPLDAVVAPAIDTKERPALSPDELDALWQRVEQLPLTSYTMAIFLAIDCGLRIGECVWLETKNVTDRITVTRSKTDAGKRTIPMTDRLRKKCEEWKKLREQRGIADAPTFCCRLNGLPLARSTMRNWYKKHREAICAPVHFHDIRHSNLSRMARYMGAHDLTRWAGWTHISMADRYVHDDFSQLEAAVIRADVG